MKPCAIPLLSRELLGISVTQPVHLSRGEARQLSCLGLRNREPAGCDLPIPDREADVAAGEAEGGKLRT